MATKPNKFQSLLDSQPKRPKHVLSNNKDTTKPLSNTDDRDTVFTINLHRFSMN